MHANRLAPRPAGALCASTLLAAALVVVAPTAAMAQAESSAPPALPSAAASTAPGPAPSVPPSSEAAPLPPASTALSAPAPSEEPPPYVPAAPRLVSAPPESPNGRDREASFATRPEGPPRYDFLRVAAGLRVGYVTDSGFDTFADTDALGQFSVDVTYAPIHKGDLSLAVGLGWDVGGRSSGLRRADAKLSANRFSVPIEGRYHVKPWLYAFGRVAPGAQLLHAEIHDSSAAVALTDSAWAFATDLSVGASIVAAGHKDYDKHRPRFWVTPEVGYGFTTSAELRPTPNRDVKDVLGTDASIDVPSLSLSGFFWRASVAMTF